MAMDPITLSIYYVVPGEDLHYVNTLNPVECIEIINNNGRWPSTFHYPIDGLVTEDPQQYYFDVLDPAGKKMSWQYLKEYVKIKFR